MTDDERIIEEAAGWLVRQRDETMDWAGFTAWLEADPRHRDIFDELALIDRELDEHRVDIFREDGEPRRSPAERQSPEPANDRGPRIGRWAGWTGSALAAAIAAILLLQPGPGSLPMQEYRSGAGKSETVKLADGTQVVLAPSSELTVRGDALALNGVGYFDVPHRPGRTLTVQAGDFRVTDIGTRFSVDTASDGVRIEIAEGKVAVASKHLPKPISLSAGHGLVADAEAGTVRLTTVEPASVAGWRGGKLQFDQAPLVLVARDLSRYSGRKVTVDPAIADRPFSGVIAIDDGGSPGTMLAQIMGLDAHPVDGGVRLEPRR